MGKVASLVLILLAMLPIVAYATNISSSQCENATVSTNYVYTMAEGVEYNDTVQDLCSFGCNANTGLCNPDPFSSDSTAIFYFLFPITSFVILYYANMLKEEDWPIHLYLTAVAFLLIVIPFGLLSTALPDPVANLYQLTLVTFFILMAYYLLRVFVFSYKQAGGKT